MDQKNESVDGQGGGSRSKERMPKTILIVEDDGIIAMKQRRTVEGFGYAVEVAHDAGEAISKGQREDIDLILTDIDLGPSSADGTEVARRILESRNVPIVFLTNHGEREMVERVRGITGYGYVLKNSGEFVLRQSIDMAFQLSATFEELETARRHADVARINRFEGALTAAGLAWWEMYLPSGRVVFDANKTRMLGYDASGFNTFQDFMALVHPDDEQAAMEAMRAHMSGRSVVYEATYRIRAADGTYHRFRDIGKAAPRESPDEELKILGLVMDLSAWRGRTTHDH